MNLFTLHSFKISELFMNSYQYVLLVIQTLREISVHMYVDIHTCTHEHTKSQNPRRLDYEKLLGSENFSARKDHT